MADRIAVMAAGRVQQIATPVGPLPAAGQPLRRRLHRLQQPVRRARRRRRLRRPSCSASCPVPRTPSRWSGPTSSYDPRTCGCCRAPRAAARCRAGCIDVQFKGGLSHVAVDVAGAADRRSWSRCPAPPTSAAATRSPSTGRPPSSSPRSWRDPASTRRSPTHDRCRSGGRDVHAGRGERAARTARPAPTCVVVGARLHRAVGSDPGGRRGSRPDGGRDRGAARRPPARPAATAGSSPPPSPTGSRTGTRTWRDEMRRAAPTRPREPRRDRGVPGEGGDRGRPAAVREDHVRDPAARGRRAAGAATALHQQYGEESVLLDADQARADVRSPTYVGGLTLHGRRAGRPGRARDRAPGRGAAAGASSCTSTRRLRQIGRDGTGSAA